MSTSNTSGFGPTGTGAFGLQTGNSAFPYEQQLSVQASTPAYTYLTAAATAGQFQITLNSVTGLMPGAKFIIFDAIAGNEEVQVANNYVIGSFVVPLTSALLFSHTSGGSSTVSGNTNRTTSTSIGCATFAPAAFAPTVSQYVIFNPNGPTAELAIATASSTAAVTIGTGTQRYHAASEVVIAGPVIAYNQFNPLGPQQGPVWDGGNVGSVLLAWDPTIKSFRALSSANPNATAGNSGTFLGVVPMIVNGSQNDAAYPSISAFGNGDSNNGNNLPAAGISAFNGANYDRLRCIGNATGVLKTTVGGGTTGTVATGAANTVIKNSAGVLCRISVTVAGTTAFTVYDNASTNSGTILFASPATTNIGTVYDVQLPAANGITVANTASGPALTVSFY